MTAHSFGVGFLALQAGGAAVWWAMLLAVPESRRYFLASGAPEATLFAFGPGDVLLYLGGSALAAVGLAGRKSWAWPVLLLHAGAATYAALYTWGLTVLTAGEGWLGAALMTPSLVGPAFLAWRLRPREGASC